MKCYVMCLPTSSMHYIFLSFNETYCTHIYKMLNNCLLASLISIFGGEQLLDFSLLAEILQCRLSSQIGIFSLSQLWPLKSYNAVFITLMIRKFKCILQLDALLVVWQKCIQM